LKRGGSAGVQSVAQVGAGGGKFNYKESRNCALNEWGGANAAHRGAAIGFNKSCGPNPKKPGKLFASSGG